MGPGVGDVEKVFVAVMVVVVEERGEADASSRASSPNEASTLRKLRLEPFISKVSITLVKYSK